jgi:hypothetical protein
MAGTSLDKPGHDYVDGSQISQIGITPRRAAIIRSFRERATQVGFSRLGTCTYSARRCRCAPFSMMFPYYFPRTGKITGKITGKEKIGMPAAPLRRSFAPASQCLACGAGRGTEAAEQGMAPTPAAGHGGLRGGRECDHARGLHASGVLHASFMRPWKIRRYKAPR